MRAKTCEKLCNHVDEGKCMCCDCLIINGVREAPNGWAVEDGQLVRVAYTCEMNELCFWVLIDGKEEMKKKPFGKCDVLSKPHHEDCHDMHCDLYWEKIE